MSDQTQQDQPTIKKVTRVFAFKLTQEDMAAKAVILGELHAKLESAERVLTAAKEEYKQAASEIAVERSAAVDAIRTGKEYRDTE